MTVGEDKLEYTGDIPSPPASMLGTKLLINSVISDAKGAARFLTADLKDHVLQLIIIEPKFIRIKARNFPKYIQK